jgi:hypothetical protein
VALVTSQGCSYQIENSSLPQWDLHGYALLSIQIAQQSDSYDKLVGVFTAIDTQNLASLDQSSKMPLTIENCEIGVLVIIVLPYPS